MYHGTMNTGISCHRSGCDCSNNNGVELTRVLTCYAYEEEMIVDVNSDMVGYTSLNNSGHTGKCCSSQAVADPRGSMTCERTHTDTEHKSMHKHCTNHHSERNEHTRTCMRPTSREHHHCHSHRKHGSESHHRRTHGSERSVVRHRHHRSGSVERHSKESSKYSAGHKTCRYHPKRTMDCDDSTGKLQVNVEVEVDSGSSTCEALKHVDIEGTLAVNTTVQPSHGNIRGNKSKTTDMNDLDVCVDSNLTVAYKKVDDNTKCVTPHTNKYDRNKPSKDVIKRGSVQPVGTSVDTSLELNSEVQLSFKLVRDRSSEFLGMTDCCGSIKDEIITFKEDGHFQKVVEDKVGKLYFKMDKCNCYNKKTLPKIVQSYEKTVIVNTKCDCAGNCHKCKSCCQNFTKEKNSLLDKNYFSEPAVKKQSLFNHDKVSNSENDTHIKKVRLSPNVSHDWNREEAIPDRDVSTRGSNSSGWVRREYMSEREGGVVESASSDWERKEPMSEREVGVVDSNSSDWERRGYMSERDDGVVDSNSSDWERKRYTSEQKAGKEGFAESGWDKEDLVPVDQDFGKIDGRVSTEAARESLPNLGAGLHAADSKGLVLDETDFKQIDPSSEDLNKVGSVSDTDLGRKHSSSTSWGRRDTSPDRHNITENGWNIDETIPEQEERISTVDPLPDKWDGRDSIVDQQEFVPDDLNIEESTQYIREYETVDPTIDEYVKSNNKDTLDGTEKLITHAERVDSNGDVLLTNTKENVEPKVNNRVKIVDSVVDYLKRGILFSSEDENVYRRRNLFSRRIGRDVLSDVGGIEASGISNEYKDKDNLVSVNEANLVLDRVDSFRNTLDETTTMISHPQLDRYWTIGPTTTYLSDRVSYFDKPTTNDKGSVPSSSESMRSGNNMLDEVSAILKQIDLPYISNVGSNIRSKSDIDIVPSSSRSAEYGATPGSNMFSFENCGMNFTNPQPVALSKSTFSNNDQLVEAPKEVKKPSILQTVFSVIGSLKYRSLFSGTSDADALTKTLLSSSDVPKTDKSISSNESVQIPKINYSNKVNFLASRGNYGHAFDYGNEPLPHGSIERDTLIHNEDNDLFLNDESFSTDKTNAPVALSKQQVDSSTKRNSTVITRNANIDTEANKKPSNYKPNDKTENSNAASLNNMSYDDRKNNSFQNISEHMTDDDSQSSSSEERTSVSGTDSEEKEETLEASTKEERIPFQGIRGYPTRLKPITLYCLCIFFLYLFWTTCYFNCSYTSYGIVRRRTTWYCRLYRAVKDSNNYKYTPEIRKVGREKLFHPFRPW